jgi:nitroreductase
MDALEALLTRRTVPPAKMTAPGPDAAALDRLIAAAVAAPDHGVLRPWRFILVEGAARAELGRLFAAAIGAEHPELGEAELAKQREAPLRAPVILIVACKTQPAHPKIPEVEQIASAAAACQNLLLAAHAQGYAAKWATGRPAYSPGVKAALGLAPADHIIGMLYLGAYAAEHAPPPRPSVDGLLQRWTGSVG